MKNSIFSLPKRKAEFIEPMECAPVTELLDGPRQNPFGLGLMLSWTKSWS